MIGSITSSKKGKTVSRESDFYQMGYNDGLYGVRKDLTFGRDESYELGYDDGYGEYLLDNSAASARAVDDEAVLGEPPAGFEFTGERKTPEPGEYYLTKNGNAKLSMKVRGNAQTRHILRPV